VTTSPSSHCLRIRRNSILPKSAGDNSKTLSATGFFDSLEQLATAIDTALDQFSLP
jgi:hypothetical protein